jgi:hypothetical protein
MLKNDESIQRSVQTTKLPYKLYLGEYTVVVVENPTYVAQPEVQDIIEKHQLNLEHTVWVEHLPAMRTIFETALLETAASQPENISQHVKEAWYLCRVVSGLSLYGQFQTEADEQALFLQTIAGSEGAALALVERCSVPLNAVNFESSAASSPIP